MSCFALHELSEYLFWYLYQVACILFCSEWGLYRPFGVQKMLRKLFYFALSEFFFLSSTWVLAFLGSLGWDLLFNVRSILIANMLGPFVTHSIILFCSWKVLPKLSSQTLHALLTSDELWVPNEEKRYVLRLSVCWMILQAPFCDDNLSWYLKVWASIVYSTCKGYCVRVTS